MCQNCLIFIFHIILKKNAEKWKSLEVIWPKTFWSVVNGKCTHLMMLQFFPQRTFVETKRVPWQGLCECTATLTQEHTALLEFSPYQILPVLNYNMFITTSIYPLKYIKTVLPFFSLKLAHVRNEVDDSDWWIPESVVSTHSPGVGVCN